jgi:hypothetical protein
MTDSDRDRLDDPREVMARAVYDSRRSYGDLNWSDAEPEDQKQCRTDADAQIAALHSAGFAINPVDDARDTEIARLRAAVQHHHDTVWGEHGPVQHDADADLYEAVGVRLGNGGTND